MATTRTLITAIVLALVTPAAISDAQPSGDAPRIHVRWNGTTIYADRTSQIDVAIDGLARYEEAGLELPPVTIEMRSHGECPTHDGTDQIAGSAGMRDGAPWITVCGGVMILLHELGHVWDRHNLSDPDRAAYIVLRGLDSWQHSEWHLAAGEHLAETMSWALADTLSQPARIPNNSVCELNDGYLQLTGDEPPILRDSGALTKACHGHPVHGGSILNSPDLAPGSNLG